MPFVTSSTSKHDRVQSFGVRLRVKTQWYSNGVMMVRRDALEGDHPEHTYNWIVRTFEGLVNPEDFGIRKPLTGSFAPGVSWSSRCCGDCLN